MRCGYKFIIANIDITYKVLGEKVQVQDLQLMVI